MWRFGEGSWIGPNSVLMDGARIGKNCRIFPGAAISAIPQDLKFAGEKTTAEVGDGTTIRECVTINRGTADRLKTAVGANCLLMAYVHLAHDCLIGNNCVIAEQRERRRPRHHRRLGSNWKATWPCSSSSTSVRTASSPVPASFARTCRPS